MYFEEKFFLENSTVFPITFDNDFYESCTLPTDAQETLHKKWVISTEYQLTAVAIAKNITIMTASDNENHSSCQNY